MTQLTKLVGLTITAIDVQKGVEDGTGFVYLDAVGADETPDIDNEIYDYQTSKPYVEAWSAGAEETTKAAGQVVSYGNVRAQHGPQGAGNVAGTVCEPIEFDDQAKRVHLRVKVIDKDACVKVAQGAYRGMSVRGGLVGKKWKDGKYYRYTVDPVEFSLVDKPANPNANFTIVKADGSTEVISPEPADESRISKAVTILHEMSLEEVKEFIAMAEDIKKAAAIEKMKAARKAHNEIAGCLGGYCDHDDAKKCAEKVAENHKKLMSAFDDDDADDAEKAAKAAEIEKAAADKAAADKKAAEEALVTEAEKAATIAKAAASTNPEVAELVKLLTAQNDTIKTQGELMKSQGDKIAALTDVVEKSAKAGRPVPLMPGAKVTSKEEETGAEKDLVEKRSAIKADDPNRVDKIYNLDRAAEPELVKI